MDPHDVKASVRAHFGAAAHDYAQSWPHRDGPDLRSMLASVDLRGDEHVLDVGSGAGHTAFAFAAALPKGRVAALDLTAAMRAQTRDGARARGLRNVETHAGDAEALPFADARFDGVVSRLAAHHFPHASRFVCEARRVLRPGGWLRLSDSIAPEDDGCDSYLQAIEVLRDPSHVRNQRISQWQAMLREAGFEDVACIGRHACPLDFDAWTRRMRTPPDAVRGLRALFRAAPDEIAATFALDREARTWQLELAVLRARRPR